MKKTLTIGLLLAGLLLSTAIAFAETEVEVTGQVRARTELTDNTFDQDAKMQKVNWLRTRIGVEATIKNNTHAFVQFQDSRMLGGMTHEGEQASGTTYAGVNVDLHQAYIEIDRMWFDGFGTKIGRFEMSFGNERVLGPVGWSNVGRSWEGVMHWYSNDRMKLTGFMVKQLERNATDGNADFDVWGLYYENKRLHMDFFAIYDYDALKDMGDYNRLSRWSFGTYYARTHKQMDYTLNAVIQTGTDGTTATETDISAYMINFEAGYNFESRTSPRLAAGIDFQTGTEDSDRKIKTYDNLYYTGHKFNGYMDYFLSSNSSGEAWAEAGLVDLMLKGNCSPWPEWTVALDIHLFRTAVDYISPIDDTPTSDLGTEFDLTVKTKSVPGVGLAWGLSYFTPKDDFAGVEPNDAGFWGYMMATAGF